MFHLIKVFIDKHKNIKGEYDFSNNNGYIALIGLNGSGKSNLLEAISIIFDGLINKGGSGIPFDYSVEYKINGITYKRAKGVAQINGKSCRAEDMHYPKNIISCYSGEDKRLWKVAYESYHYSYFNKAVKSEKYNPTILYINKYCWKIALLSILCSNKPSVKLFLKDVLRIESPIDVTVSFEYNSNNKNGYLTNPSLKWFERIIAEGTEKINANFIATTDVIIASKQVDDSNKASSIFYFLYLLSQPKKNNKNKIDKLITDITINLGKINFDDLSEGQKKLILIECIMSILGDDNSLILLDEPDAHSHISMQKDMLKSIANFKGQTIFTTHSPFFLNKQWDGYKDGNIFYFNNGEIKSIEPLSHLSELTDNTVDYFQGAYLLSSKNILIVEGKYDDKYLKKAITIHSRKDPKYEKLNLVSILSANSAGASEVIYTQVLSHCIERFNKVIFLFDYDSGGWKDGWQKIYSIAQKQKNIIPIFYQDEYPSEKYPFDSVKVKNMNGSEDIKRENSFLIEDMFSDSSYRQVIEQVIKAKSHKDFRTLPYGKKGTAERIKEFIEKNYDGFDEKSFDGFKPILDYLMKLYEFE